MLSNSLIKIWNLVNQMKKQNKKHQNARSIDEKLKTDVLCFIFFIWFARFQILICEPQSILRKLLVLSTYTLIRKHNFKTNSEFKRFFKQSDHFEKEITNKHTMIIAKKLYIIRFYTFRGNMRWTAILLAKSTKNIQKPWKYNDAFSL